MPFAKKCNISHRGALCPVAVAQYRMGHVSRKDRLRLCLLHSSNQRRCLLGTRGQRAQESVSRLISAGKAQQRGAMLQLVQAT